MTARELSLPQRVFRSVWPFWQFKDASRGDLYARALAYRHNRSLRVHLPRYLLRWFAGCCVALGAICAFDSMATPAQELNVFVLMAVGSGILFAASACVLFVIGYVYLYLGHNKH